MKIYLVWFRLAGDEEDRIRGAARSWERAEKMAENLEFYLKASGCEEFDFGVKSYVHGKMRWDFMNDDGCFSSWGKDKFGE